MGLFSSLVGALGVLLRYILPHFERCLFCAVDIVVTGTNYSPLVKVREGDVETKRVDSCASVLRYLRFVQKLLKAVLAAAYCYRQLVGQRVVFFFLSASFLSSPRCQGMRRYSEARRRKLLCLVAEKASLCIVMYLL